MISVIEKEKREIFHRYGKIIEDATKEHMMKIESYIKLRIRPRPKWMPPDLWKFLLKKMLRLEYFMKEPET